MNSVDWEGLQFAACFYLTGVIWVIQLIHYPAFAYIAEKNFVRFHARHTSVMGAIVGPIMTLELITAIVLCYQFQVVWVLNLAGVVVVWLATFLWSVPCHTKLAQGPDSDQLKKLVQGNWLRTFVWTLRSIIFCLLIFSSHEH